MSRTTKIVLGLFAGLLGLCLVAFVGIVAVSGFAFASAAHETRSVAPDDMVVYTMPAGYHFAFDTHLLGGTLVAMDADDGAGTFTSLCCRPA